MVDDQNQNNNGSNSESSENKNEENNSVESNTQENTPESNATESSASASPANVANDFEVTLTGEVVRTVKVTPGTVVKEVLASVGISMLSNYNLRSGGRVVGVNSTINDNITISVVRKASAG